MSSASESDKEFVLLTPKKKVKMPVKGPAGGSKTTTTKEMVHAALKELNTRKGVSLYAIKKHMIENFQINTEKRGYHIKKYIKVGVEEGVILQTTGIGASGSFKLAPVKKTEAKAKKENAEPKAGNSKKNDEETIKKRVTNNEKEVTKEKSKEIKSKTTVERKTTEKTKNVKVTTQPMQEKKSVPKAAGNKNTKKPKGVIRRKSIGSIVKPPAMKPKKRD